MPPEAVNPAQGGRMEVGGRPYTVNVTGEILVLNNNILSIKQGFRSIKLEKLVK